MRIKLFKFFRGALTFLYISLLIGAFNLLRHFPSMSKDDEIAFAIIVITSMVVVGIREFLDMLIIQSKKKDKASSTDNT